jgi:hypothetical protein
MQKGHSYFFFFMGSPQGPHYTDAAARLGVPFAPAFVLKVMNRRKRKKKKEKERKKKVERF